MENLIVPAPQSPRMDNGVLKWFFGDTFAVDMVINLVEQTVDENGETTERLVDFSPDDQIIVTFFNFRKEPIHSFIIRGIGNDESSEDYHTATLEFDKDVSHKFRVGKYTYCMKYVHKENGRSVSTDITTICVNNKVEVERCH